MSQVFGVDGRAVQRKISTVAKKELSISELMMLADYFGCDVMDLVILEDEPYAAPRSDWKDGWRKIEIEDKSPEEVNRTLEFMNERKEDCEIRNLYEFLLYLPLMEDEELRNVVFRCYGDLTYDMNKFFEIWSSMDIRLADFDTFYYGYLKMIENVQTICGVKQSALNKEIYKKSEGEIIEIIKEYAELNKDNEYYMCLVQAHIDKYLKKPNKTNLNPCIRESTVYGALSAYRLFYVGCSRARRNLEIIIRNEDVMAFKDQLSNKFEHCGFEILQE